MGVYRVQGLGFRFYFTFCLADPLQDGPWPQQGQMSGIPDFSGGRLADPNIDPHGGLQSSIPEPPKRAPETQKPDFAQNPVEHPRPSESFPGKWATDGMLRA